MAQVDDSARSRGRYLAGFLVFVLALAGSAGLAEAKKPKKAKLQVSVPSHVTVGSNFDIRMHGFAGKYNRVDYFLHAGNKCEKTAGAELSGNSGYRHDVASHKKFDLTRTFHSASPGPHVACVYLFDKNNYFGPQIAKTTKYTSS